MGVAKMKQGKRSNNRTVNEYGTTRMAYRREEEEQTIVNKKE